MLLDMDLDIQVARRTTVHAWLAVARRPDPHAIVDTSGNLHFQRLVALDAARTGASSARLGYHLAGTVALRAGLLDAEESLLHAHLAMTGTGGASGRLGTRLGTAAVTDFATVPRWHADRRVETVRRLLERDVEVVAQVGTTIDLWSGTAATAPAAARGIAEDVAKDVAERIRKTTRAGTAETTAATATHVRIDTGVTIAVKRFAFLRIGQHLVGLLGLLEFVFRSLAVGIAVRMVFHG